jgi:hypothetical protein
MVQGVSLGRPPLESQQYITIAMWVHWVQSTPDVRVAGIRRLWRPTPAQRISSRDHSPLLAGSLRPACW